jgi:hypothetical protein
VISAKLGLRSLEGWFDPVAVACWSRKINGNGQDLQWQFLVKGLQTEIQGKELVVGTSCGLHGMLIEYSTGEKSRIAVRKLWVGSVIGVVDIGGNDHTNTPFSPQFFCRA